MLSLAMEMAIHSKIPSLEKISIIPHSSSELLGKPSTSTKMNALRRNIRWRQPAFRIDRNKQKPEEE